MIEPKNVGSSRRVGNTGASSRPVRDWVRSRRGFVVAWGIPITIYISLGFLGLPAALTVALWGGALVWMGMSCVLNARRCGRLHCFFTGPYMLVLAGLVFIHGFGIVPLGERADVWLSYAFVIGVPVLWLVPEMIWGKYVGRTPDRSR